MSPNLRTVSAVEMGLHTVDTDKHFPVGSLNQGNRSGRGPSKGSQRAHVPSVPVAPPTGALELLGSRDRTAPTCLEKGLQDTHIST